MNPAPAELITLLKALEELCRKLACSVATLEAVVQTMNYDSDDDYEEESPIRTKKNKV